MSEVRRVEIRPYKHGVVELTFDCFLTLSLVSTSDDQSLGIHGCEVHRSLESYSSVGSSDHNDLSGKVSGDERNRSRELLFQEVNDGELGHDKRG